MESYVQIIVNALTLGLVYALVAVGFSMIFGAGRILFLAHGEIYSLGAIIGFYFIQALHVPYIFTLIITMVVIGAFGVVIERFLRPFRRQELPTLVISTALAMLFAHVILLAYGPEERVISSPFRGTIEIFGSTLSTERGVIILFSVAAVLALHFFSQRTKAGQAIRAVTQDTEAALLQGINVNRTHMLVFVLAFAAAGMAAILITPLYYIDPFGGTPALMRTFIVVILGGLGSFPGAIVGGLLLGFVESFTYTFLGGLAAYPLSFMVVIVVLVIRPQGLLGRE
jgi:branched-chain amino acid transport system permease protein